MKIAVVDDTEADRRHLAACLDQYSRQAGLNYSLTTFPSGDEFLRKEDFNSDLIFLDIYMNGTSGMDTAIAIRQQNKDCFLIFTTTSADFAAKSYRVRAFDYLVKPYSYEQFAETMGLLDKDLVSSSSFIQVKANRMQVRIRCQDIIFADYYNHYVCIHTVKEPIRSLMPFEELEKKLAAYPQFLVCNRNCLLNMEQVVSVPKDGFKMSSGEVLTIKRGSEKELRQHYADFLFTKLNQLK